MGRDDIDLPILDGNDTPDYARGIEIGLLAAQMMFEDEIRGQFLRSNQEQILLMANRFGYAVKLVRPYRRHWFKCVMIRDTNDSRKRTER